MRNSAPVEGGWSSRRRRLAERSVGIRNLANPIKVDSCNAADPMPQLAVVLLALFGQLERT